ncbi:hypothetical protein B0O80DRAFT_269472 [Mortierella sp. GBAus27b]|nr:hypothetical protein BGX31_004726 [Mortierella sp. GBA43]KAI8345657.1 hypothetical protein B0O80DRAFT_269472 [Mortierella sp. GBAus27b]
MASLESTGTPAARVHTTIDIEADPIRPQPPQFRTASQRSPVRYCCCFPIASGIWLIPLFLIIPSIALVLSFNVANLQKLIQFRSPVSIKIVYTVIYSLYALLGIVAGLGLPRLSINRRLKVLILLYWFLITATIIEGVYFGIVMAKQKNKWIGYCDEGTISKPGSPTTVPANPIPTGSPGTKRPAILPNTPACQKAQDLVGAFYIVGPGGWLVLHCGWILIVVLYSKALRSQYPADEEIVAFKAVTGPKTDQHLRKRQDADPKDQTTHGIQMGTYNYQEHPFQRPVSPSDSGRIGTMFRNMNPWASSQDRLQSASRHTGEQDGKGVYQDEDGYDSADDLEVHPGRTNGSSHISMASKTDVPADGKGWWIRQIEGKRRGEICPCTRGAQESCWCGKQRLQNVHSRSSSEAGPSGTTHPSSNSLPAGQPGGTIQSQEQPLPPVEKK